MSKGQSGFAGTDCWSSFFRRYSAASRAKIWWTMIYWGKGHSRITEEGIRLYTRADFDGMRNAGSTVAGILDEVCDIVRVGITTGEIDEFVNNRIDELGVDSATIGYRGYRHATCISVNHVVCHGIPGPKRLDEGDILNVDVTVIVDGWYGDSSRMFVAGKPSRRAARLIQVTHDALMIGLEEVMPGKHFGDIGAAIERHATRHRMSVVREFCGHGLGKAFHLPPNVLHFGIPGSGPRLREGMFFTVEPMINLGQAGTKILQDNWTAVTRDKSLSAQFEHSIGVTADGCELFTVSPANRFHPTNWETS